LRVSEAELASLAAETGFRSEILEKVIQLLNLLSAIFSHPYLKDRLVLKGGTALNLFILEIPRLSVDIDLNYIGAVDKDKMLEERPKIEKAVRDVCAREEIDIIRAAAEYAGGKWRLKYQTDSNQGGNLELDLNFILRIPLWDVVKKDSRHIGHYSAKSIPILDDHELASGKLAALFARRKARDIFDTPHLITRPHIDAKLLRMGFVAYAAMNSKDFRHVSIEDIRLDDKEYNQQLLPMLSSNLEINKSELIKQCQDSTNLILPLKENEIEFIRVVREEGRIEPSLITMDAGLIDILLIHPGLLWRVAQLQEIAN